MCTDGGPQALYDLVEMALRQRKRIAHPGNLQLMHSKSLRGCGAFRRREQGQKVFRRCGYAAIAGLALFGVETITS
jgi:hypothetical protein